jgi:(4S)-4-hydroxy-5-phosphonooxypentane-2,3-dione isomerase
MTSILLRSAAITLVDAAMCWLPSAPKAAAQSALLYISAVDLQIAPASVSRFVAALQSDGAAMVKEPQAREFDSAVSQKDPGHVFVFEVYDNAAAYDAHQKTAAYGKFITTTMMLIKTYDIRPFAAAAMNANGAVQPGAGPYLIDRVELDIVPAQLDAFMSAAKDNAAASAKDDGCRAFDIAVAQKDPHHVMFLEVYDNAAALAAHEATDHFKTYQTATKDMVAKRQSEQFSSAAMLTKPQ